MAANTRTGGEVLADALLIHGVEMAFCVAGESYLALLDALHDRRDGLRLITCRQEGGAANMAEAYAKTTGRPGVVMVTRGPGACHGAIGLHTALQDSTPMVMLIGQVARDQFDREAFQEIDYRRMFGQVTKWVAQIEDADRIPEYLARAFRTATSGRPGPVALALPEDMLRDRVAVGDTGPYRTVRAAPGPGDMAELGAMLAEAKRPMMLVGGGGWTPGASEDIVAFAEANDLPTACSFRRLDLFDNASGCFAGDLTTGSNPKLSAAVREADLLVVAGARLGEITTQGYRLLEPPAPQQRIVHIHASAEELGSVFQPALAVQSGPEQFAAAARALEPVAGDRAGWCRARRADWLAWSEPEPSDAALDLGRCMVELRGRLGSDGIVTVDAGNFSGWPMRYLRFRRRHTFAGPTSGAMGYSVAAAVGAALANPDHHRVRQRHVRHHPHAPGAPPQRPPYRNRPRQPGFRHAGAGPRTARRDRRTDRGVRPRLRPRTGLGHGSRDLPQAGSEHHLDHHHLGEDAGRRTGGLTPTPRPPGDAVSRRGARPGACRSRRRPPPPVPHPRRHRS